MCRRRLGSGREAETIKQTTMTRRCPELRKMMTAENCNLTLAPGYPNQVTNQINLDVNKIK